MLSVMEVTWSFWSKESNEFNFVLKPCMLLILSSFAVPSCCILHVSYYFNCFCQALSQKSHDIEFSDNFSSGTLPGFSPVFLNNRSMTIYFEVVRLRL